MGMPAPEPITTIEELLALPEDGLGHELLDGEHVVSPAPSPNHQRAVGEFWDILRRSIQGRTDVEVFGSPADIQLSPRTLVQPDVFILRTDPHRRLENWADAPVPILAVEILSPTTAARDRGAKRRLYLEAGVEEYWIADLDARIIERWRRGDDRPEVVDEVLESTLSIGVSWSVALPEVFGRILGGHG